METIINIEEIKGDDGYRYYPHANGYYDPVKGDWVDGPPPGSKYAGYSGYEIVTDKQRIFFGISNQQECCEDWGYLTTVDKVDDYIGARLVEITRTDTQLTNHIVTLADYHTDEEAIFVNFVTDRGVFQLTAYNEHNGYYGHSVTMKSEQLSFDAGV